MCTSASASASEDFSDTIYSVDDLFPFLKDLFAFPEDVPYSVRLPTEPAGPGSGPGRGCGVLSREAR